MTSPAWVHAQAAWPSRGPVRLIAQFPPGGLVDTVARVMGPHLSQAIGQTVVVENRAGAGGAIGAQATAAAAPDGYTIGFVSSGYAWMTAINPNLQFNPKDLQPIALICATPYIVLARTEAPFNNLQQFIAYAKANPGKAAIGSAGVGTLTHLLPAWLMAETNTKWIHVPFNGTAPAMQALLGGQVDVIFDPVSTSLPQVQNKRGKPLAVTGNTRLKALPDVGTMPEAGYQARGSTWFGLMAPTAVPKPIIERLNREVNGALDEPEVRQRLEGLYFSIESGSIQHFADFLDAQVRAWTKIVKDNNIKGD